MASRAKCYHVWGVHAYASPRVSRPSLLLLRALATALVTTLVTALVAALAAALAADERHEQRERRGDTQRRHTDLRHVTAAPRSQRGRPHAARGEEHRLLG